MDKKKGKLKWIMLHHTKLRHTMIRRILGIILVFVMVLSTMSIDIGWHIICMIIMI